MPEIMLNKEPNPPFTEKSIDMKEIIVRSFISFSCDFNNFNFDFP